MQLSSAKSPALQRGQACSRALLGRSSPGAAKARAVPRPIVAAASYAGAGGWEGRTQPTVGWQSGNEDQSARNMQEDYQRRWAQAMQENQRRQQTQGSMQTWDAAPSHQQQAHSWGQASSGWGSHHQQQQQQQQQQHANGAHQHANGAQQHANGTAHHSSHTSPPIEDIGGGQGAGSPSTVEFKVKFATDYGQRLKIVGNAPALGAWDLDQSPDMVWSDGNVWSVTVQLSQSSVVEYKYVVVDDWGGATWQQGNNNVLAIKIGQDKLQLADRWDGSAGTLTVGDGASTETMPVSREAQLLSRTNEIEAMMATTRHQLRQWRVDLDTAKEEVKVARMEVAHVRSELQAEKVTTKRQALEIKLLKEENYELKTKLTESNAGFKSALETARMLLAQIEESGGTLPPLPEMHLPQVVERTHA